MFIENGVNCWDTQTGQSAAKPVYWDVQRSSRNGVDASASKRTAPAWQGDNMISSHGLNHEQSTDGLEFTTLGEDECKQYGSYVNTTDVMLAAAADPVLSTIVERQSQQAGETLDFLSYKVFRAGTQVQYASGQSQARASVNHTIGNLQPLEGTAVNANSNSNLFDIAIRKLEQNDAKKMRNMLRASVGIATQPIRESFIGICHPDMRQDLENLSDFIPVEKYSEAGQAIDGEIGSVKGVRIITTTQATPFASAGGATSGNTDGSGEASYAKTSGSSKADVYPLIILAQDFGGCATLGGMDSLRSKVVTPKPGPGDPLGQRGTVAWDTLRKSVFTSEGVSNNSVNCWESRNCQSAAKPSGEGSTTIPFWEYSQAAGSAEQPTGLVI